MAQKTILSDTPENLIKKYHEVLKTAKIPVEKIIIFGSYAKGEPKSWSNLDLCIVSKSFGKDSYQETVPLHHLATKVDPMIEPHPYNPKDLDNPLDPFASEIKKTGKLAFTP